MFGTIAPRIRSLVVNAALRVAGGGPNQILYQDANQNLASSSVWTVDPSNSFLNVGGLPLIKMGPVPAASGYSGLWVGQASPVFNNSIFTSDGTTNYLCSASAITLRVAGNAILTTSPVGTSMGFNPPALPSNTTCMVTATSSNYAILVLRSVASQTGNVLTFQGISSTATARDLGYINTGFTVSTDASRTGYVTIAAQDFNAAAGGREGIRVTSSGTEAMVGFFGATPVVQQTGGAATAGATYTSAEQAMLQAVYNAVRAYGLMI